MKTLYISGAISSDPKFAIKFFKKSYELESKGYKVLSPTMIQCKLEYEQYMHIDFAMIDVCDALYVMKDWKESEGAKREISYATRLNKEIIYE